MFFIWLVMPTNVGKQHLPSQMNRRHLVNAPMHCYWIAMACQLAIQVQWIILYQRAQKTLQ